MVHNTSFKRQGWKTVAIKAEEGKYRCSIMLSISILGDQLLQSVVFEGEHREGISREWYDGIL